MPTTNIPTTNIIVSTTNIIAPATNIIAPTTNLIVPTTNNFPFINNTSDYYIYENYTYGIIPIQNISSIPLTDSFNGTIFSTTLDDTIIEKGINPLTTQLLEESKISTIIQENNTMTTLEIIETDINTTSLITSITQPNSQTDYSNNDKTYYQSQSYKKISEYISQIESNFITNLIITGNNEEVYQEVINNVIQNYYISKGKEMIFKGEDNCFFHITSSQNELELLKGNNNNTNKFSIIDLGECENILKDHYKINKNLSLLIMKFEKVTNISSERSLQYEVYDLIIKQN